MKRIAIFVLVASVYLFVPSLVSANDSDRSQKPFMQKVQTAKQEMKEKSASREGQRKEKLDEIRKSTVTKFFDTMIKRFEAAVERLNKILARIESRVAKIKSEHPTVSLTNIEAQIASVKTSLTNTQAKIDTLKINFNAAIASTTPGESFKSIKEEVSAIKKDLEDIKRTLSKIVGEIKGLRVGEDKK